MFFLLYFFSGDLLDSFFSLLFFLIRYIPETLAASGKVQLSERQLGMMIGESILHLLRLLHLL